MNPNKIFYTTYTCMLFLIISGNGILPDSPESLFYTSGYNNNMCFVIPGWKMIVIRMGLDGNPPEGKQFVYNEFFKVLSKAINNE